MGVGAIVVSQIGCVLLRNLLFVIATRCILLSGFILLSPTMGEGPHWVIVNRRVVGDIPVLSSTFGSDQNEKSRYFRFN